jgi:DNA polymerase III gamma/tau subunit
MASNFSANQYEKSFKSTSLCNWEVPHWYPQHPNHRTITTNFIANDRGHLLSHIERPKSSPWGRFRNTWQLPKSITRQQANEINAPQVGWSRWALPDPSRKVRVKSAGVQVEVKQEKVEEPKKVSHEKREEAATEAANEPKKVFNEKEKLNSPLAIARQGRRVIRHETLERDHDKH